VAHIITAALVMLDRKTDELTKPDDKPPDYKADGEPNQWLTDEDSMQF